MSGEHERGDRKGKFCTTPAAKICDDCPGSMNYIDVCEPNWSAHTFERMVKAKANPFVFDKKYEAHHILCVAPVTQELLGDKKIRGAVEQTKWCINKELNMLAMPLWGHTVKWYCSIDQGGGDIDVDVGAPPFKNIPQHDFDHNCKQGYTWEVEEEMKKRVQEIKDSEHKLKGDSLAGALDDCANDFADKLKKRGKRKGGTHKAWKLAQQEPPDPNWCHPFSMASDSKVSSVGFPARNFQGKVDQWINRIAQAIAGP